MTDPLDEELAARQAKSKTTKRKSSGDRWHTLNTFVDNTMQTMKANEIAVWVFMFRHTRDGIVGTSVRQISDCLGISTSTTQIALNRLVERGIIERVKKSKHHGEPSIFKVHAKPRP